MTVRKCGTCKHFEPSPMRRMGWCRNPHLYAPQQSHLVHDDDLDCERGMGNYWEAADGDVVLPLTLQNPERTIYPVSGSSDDEPIDDEDYGPPPRSPRSERRLDYLDEPEDSHWSDYIRIGAPILGLLLLLLLALVWILSLGGDDDETAGNVTGSPTRTLPLITGSPTGGQTPPGTGTPIVLITRTPQAPTPPPGQATLPPSGGEIYAGATVQVANTGGTGANLRADASTSAEVVTVLLDGTELVTTGNPVEAEGYVWWPVEGEGVSGYIVEDFLVLVE